MIFQMNKHFLSDIPKIQKYLVGLGLHRKILGAEIMSPFLSNDWLYIFFVLEFPQFLGETRILFEKREFTIGDKRKKTAAYSTINWKIEIERGQIRWFNNKGHGLVSCYQKKVDKQHH